MEQRAKKTRLWLSSSGQNMIEYLVVFVGIITILFIAFRPSGIFTRRIGDTLETAVVGTKCLALEVCYDSDGCDPVCGNGCCEEGETEGNCSNDCEGVVCQVNEDCDDSNACTNDTCNSNNCLHASIPNCVLPY